MLATKLLRSGARASIQPRSSFWAIKRFQHTQAEGTRPENASRLADVPPIAAPKLRKIQVDQAKWAVKKRNGIRVKTTGENAKDNTHLFHAAFLRDACTCPKCVNPDTTQKKFSTTDISLDIKVKSVECSEEGIRLAWENDIAGSGDDHISFISRSFLNSYLTSDNLQHSLHNKRPIQPWSKAQAQALKHFSYESYMKDDTLLLDSLSQLHSHGFFILEGVPQEEKSVESIAGRIGTLRDTFYGRTWNVKSTPQAKNVAYTQSYLGLHMDLLYMQKPPGLQFLHCLKNTCHGGSSLLSDSFNTLISFPSDYWKAVACKMELAYHYKNDGQYYYRSHPLVERKLSHLPLTLDNLDFVNYSPPFQAPLPRVAQQEKQFRTYLEALQMFTKSVEAEENMFEYKMNEGECVVFNNRRVLHGRREFDSMSGERWLKGCYVDTDVFESRLRVLQEKGLGSSET